MVHDMTTDATFLGLIDADREAMPVYADWLEERGEAKRAAFVRIDYQLRAITPRQRRAGALALADQLRELGARMPAAWLGAMSRPRLAGTAWRGRDDDGFLILRFLEGGVLNYSQSSGTFQNGTWSQLGSAVVMETNAHYADYHGVIVGDRIRGLAHNIVRKQWAFSVVRTDDPEVVRLPERVVTTVFGHHPRRMVRRRRKSRS